MSGTQHTPLTNDELDQWVAYYVRIAPAAETTVRFKRMTSEIRTLREHKGDLLAALKVMRDTHGTHGPCEQNDCKSCERAYDKAEAAIAKVKGKTQTVAE